ncbi:MAG: hypothetical protein QOF01_1760 [Thermomicrobiales bacterium]|jgi:hypothetical protein|nr:hypothetical protein [Thermomicrobiales bacterium]MEA2595291.1 hypothetical protein [Thermomicrobiales bacterium]
MGRHRESAPKLYINGGEFAPIAMPYGPEDGNP